MNKPHHEDDGRIGFAEFEDVLKHWNEKLGRALDHAFALASEHAGYSGDPRYFPWPDNIAELPISQKANLSEVRMNNTGVAAAASTDGRIGDGLIVISENPSGEQEPIRFYNHSAYRLLAPTLSPVAEPGDTLLVKNYGTPRPRNLVVAAHSEKLLARRLNDVEGQSDVSVLTGQARDPYILPEAAIALKDRLEPKKIIGTLFTAGTATIITPSEHEIAAIEDFSSIKYQVENTRLLKVTGHSMQPIALDGQFVLVKNETIDEGALTALEGKLVIAVSSDNAKYFKRLRLKDQFVILESVNSDASSGTELLSLAPQNGFEHLTEIYSVRGVLFEDPS
jgi:SOS-response transcriptional repressor LexA